VPTLICGIFNFFGLKFFVIELYKKNMILAGKLVLVLAVVWSVRSAESLNSDLDITSTLARDIGVLGQENCQGLALAGAAPSQNRF
jgi:hypothetical protein